MFSENSDVINIKLNICQQRIYAKSGTFVICQEWDFCDMLTGNICQKWNICQEWDFCDMPTGDIVWEGWRLFSENGDVITGQKLIKN